MLVTISRYKLKFSPGRRTQSDHAQLSSPLELKDETALSPVFHWQNVPGLQEGRCSSTTQIRQLKNHEQSLMLNKKPFTLYAYKTSSPVMKFWAV